MDIQTILILIAIGLCTGILGGMVGIGGGVILVPALIFFLSFPQLKAQGTSLALLMFPVGILGVIQYYQKGNVDFSVVAILAIGFIAGSYFGSKFSLANPAVAKKIFAVVMILIAGKMLFLDKDSAEKDTPAVQQKTTKQP